MPALGFQQQHVASVLNGSKPFTMRSVRKDGHCPKVGDPLFLFENWRTPDMRRFATATCMLRVTLWFDEKGIAKVQHDGMNTGGPIIMGRVAATIVAAGSADVREQEAALHQLALWDGFASWTELWAWHSANGRLDANGHALRRLIGLGSIVPEPGYDVQPVLAV